MYVNVNMKVNLYSTQS